MKIEQYEQEHLDLLYPHLGECTLFLKRDDAFPLDKPCSIAAYGNGVRHTVKGGTGSGEVNSRFFINVEEGLKQTGFTLTTSEWLDKYDEICKNYRKTWVKSMKKEAHKAHARVSQTNADNHLFSATANAAMGLKPQYNKSGSVSSSVSMLAVKQPYLFLTTSNLAIPSNYQHYAGFPCNMTGKLNTFSGFTVVESIRLNDLVATTPEVEEIYQLLKEGVII